MRSREEWMELIRECSSSGVSASAWCKARGIATGSYYSAVSKLRECGLIPAQDSVGSHAGGRSLPQVVQINLDEPASPEMNADMPGDGRLADTAARISSCGMLIELTNAASSDAVMNILSSLQRIC